MRAYICNDDSSNNERYIFSVFSFYEPWMVQNNTLYMPEWIKIPVFCEVEISLFNCVDRRSRKVPPRGEVGFPLSMGISLSSSCVYVCAQKHPFFSLVQVTLQNNVFARHLVEQLGEAIFISIYVQIEVARV